MGPQKEDGTLHNFDLRSSVRVVPLSDYAAPAATVAVAVIGAIAGRLTATRKTRELQHLQLLLDTVTKTDPETPEGKTLRAQVIYEVEFYAVRNSGGSKSSRTLFGFAIALAIACAGYFGWLTLDSLNDDPVDYGLSTVLALPTVVSFIVALIYAGRFDRVVKELQVREVRDETLAKLTSDKVRRRLLKRSGISDTVIDQMFPPD